MVSHQVEVIMHITVISPSRLTLLVLILWLLCPCHAENSTPAGSPEIQISPGTDSIEIGDTLLIEGKVSDSIIGISPGDAVIILKKPASSRIDTFVSVPVGDDGMFRYPVTVDVTGTWTLSARYGSETSAASEVKVIPREMMIRTRNTLNSFGSPADFGGLVEMHGYLRDTRGAGVPNRQIRFMVALPPYGCSICDHDDSSLIWQTYGTATTDENGHYSLSFNLYDHGEHRVRTSFSGDEVFLGSASATRSVRVS